MIKAFYFLLIVFSLLGCTKYHVEETLPEISDISPEHMHSELARININVDQGDFDHMYASYLLDIHVPAEIEYFNKDGHELFTKNASIEIKGAGSAQNPMKSIGIVFDEKINNAAFQIINTAQALPGDHLDQLQSVRLRNSGNDDGITHFKDLALTELAIKNSLDLELKYGVPVQVFVNEEYFGLLNLRNENDRIGLSDLLHVDVDAITMMKMDFPDEDIDFREGDEQLAQSLIDAIKAKDGYALNQLVDMENFIDYILYEDYLGNMDWPHNNAKLYSVNGSKFRFLLFDLDFAATRNKTQRLPKMEYLTDDISKMYQIFREHDNGFIETLEIRQRAMYNLFSTSKFNAVVDELSLNIKDEIPYLIQRWGAPHSTFEWHLNVDRLKQDFEVNEFYNRKMYGFK